MYLHVVVANISENFINISNISTWINITDTDIPHLATRLYIVDDLSYIVGISCGQPNIYCGLRDLYCGYILWIEPPILWTTFPILWIYIVDYMYILWVT